MTASTPKTAGTNISSFLELAGRHRHVAVQTEASPLPTLPSIVKTGVTPADRHPHRGQCHRHLSAPDHRVPMLHYGRDGKYDYDNNMFGFVKGDLIPHQVVTSPSAPAVHLRELVQRRCHPAEEPDLLEGRAQDHDTVIWRRRTNKIPGVVSGTIDVTDPSYSRLPSRSRATLTARSAAIPSDKPRRQPQLRLCHFNANRGGRRLGRRQVMNTGYDRPSCGYRRLPRYLLCRLLLR